MIMLLILFYYNTFYKGFNYLHLIKDIYILLTAPILLRVVVKDIN